MEGPLIIPLQYEAAPLRTLCVPNCFFSAPSRATFSSGSRAMQRCRNRGPHSAVRTIEYSKLASIASPLEEGIVADGASKGEDGQC